MPEPMTPDELERWKTKQINAAIAIGINPLDAANAVKRFLDKLPYGADPNTYIPPAYTLEQDLTSAEVKNDLRAEWYERAPRRFKRLLDAGSEA